jgi:hypothetical protein
MVINTIPSDDVAPAERVESDVATLVWLTPCVFNQRTDRKATVMGMQERDGSCRKVAMFSDGSRLSLWWDPEGALTRIENGQGEAAAFMQELTGDQPES